MKNYALRAIIDKHLTLTEDGRFDYTLRNRAQKAVLPKTGFYEALTENDLFTCDKQGRPFIFILIEEGTISCVPQATLASLSKETWLKTREFSESEDQNGFKSLVHASLLAFMMRWRRGADIPPSVLEQMDFRDLCPASARGWPDYSLLRRLLENELLQYVPDHALREVSNGMWVTRSLHYRGNHAIQTMKAEGILHHVLRYGVWRNRLSELTEFMRLAGTDNLLPQDRKAYDALLFRIARAHQQARGQKQIRGLGLE